MTSRRFRWPRSLRAYLARATIRLGALACPDVLRDDFIEEWEAELWHALVTPGSPGVWALCRGVLPHAISQRPATKTRKSRSALSSTALDLRFALRSMRARPSHFALAVGTLALGIGATTSIFTIFDHVLLRNLPYEDPSSLVVLGTVYEGGGPNLGLTSTSAPSYLDWKERTQSFESMAGVMNWQSVVLYGEPEPERVRIAHVSEDFFSLLGIRPERGRAFAAQEYEVGSPPVAILSHGLWQRRFGGDKTVLGRTITNAENPFTIVGIMPSDMTPPEALWVDRADLWMPVDFRDPELSSRTRRIMRVVARLAPEATLDAAREELDLLGAALVEEYPNELIFRESRALIGIAPMHEETVGDASQRLYVLLGAVVILLLIACANVVNLSLARATKRAPEMAVRTALGAGRARLMRQLVTESLVVSSTAALMGAIIAITGVEALARYGPADIPRLSEVSVDARILAFTILLSIAIGITFGLAPMLSFSPRRAEGALGDAKSSGGMRASWFRRTLVVFETALALMLLAGAGLLMKSFVRLTSVEPGFNPEQVYTLPVRLGDAYAMEQRDELFRSVLARLDEHPAIEAASAVMNLPIGDVNWRTGTYAFGEDANGEAVPVNIHMAYPGYFEAMAIPRHRGRDFLSTDRRGGPEVAVVNESLAKIHWPHEDPIGQRLRIGYEDDAPWLTVIGVIGDVRQGGLTEAPPPELYRAYRQAQQEWMQRMHFVAKYRGEEAIVADALKEAVWSHDAKLALHGAGSLNARIGRSVKEPRFYAALLSSVALVAVLLAGAGIYGTLLYVVEQRSREVGIRIAIGAGASDVVRLVVSQGMTLVALGTATGLLGAFATSRFLKSFLFDVTPLDAATLLLVTLGVVLVGWNACYWPARRAAATDPTTTLRSE